MMAATKEDIRQWFLDGLDRKATHMIIVCDTLEYEDYPVYVLPTEHVLDKKSKYHVGNMQQVMEVYNLSLDMDKQLSQPRVFNY